jgi:hypothetical protein
MIDVEVVPVTLGTCGLPGTGAANISMKSEGGPAPTLLKAITL